MINAYARWFGIVIILGVVLNIVLSVLGLFIPEKLLAFLHLEPAIPTVWVRFSANLLILLSLFYLPAALDFSRYQANAWLAVFARLAGVTFFLTQPKDYLIFGFFDLSFFIPEAILLFLALRQEKSPTLENS